MLRVPHVLQAASQHVRLKPQVIPPLPGRCRDACDYWREALRRDPGDARCNQALGLWHLRRGEAAAAERCLRAAVGRLTARNPNPADGEAHYGLGLALRARGGRDKEAYAAFYKSTWNWAWRSPAFYQLAQVGGGEGCTWAAVREEGWACWFRWQACRCLCLARLVAPELSHPWLKPLLPPACLAVSPLQMDAARGEWETAAQHCRAALATNADFLQASYSLGCTISACCCPARWPRALLPCIAVPDRHSDLALHASLFPLLKPLPFPFTGPQPVCCSAAPRRQGGRGCGADLRQQGVGWAGLVVCAPRGRGGGHGVRHAGGSGRGFRLRRRRCRL